MSSNAIEEDFEIIQNNVPSVNNTGNEQNWQTSTVRSEQFHKVDKIVQDNPVKPLVLAFNNMQICAFFRHASMPELDVLSKACRSQWRCETCAGRSRSYGKLSAPSGPVFMSPAIMALCKPHMGLDAELYEEMGEATSRLAKAPIIGIRIQRTASIAGHPREAGGFIHWMLPIDENDRTSEKVDEKLASRLEKACHRYLPKDLPSLVDKLIGDGSASAVQSALDSLNLMETCLHKATYGDRWLGAFRWIRAIVQELKDKSLVPSAMTEAERWGFYARHLLGSNCILEEANDTAVCPFYHTVNGNIVDLLETAHSESAMVAMITERLAPQNYQRRDVTAQLSEGEVNIAMKALGEFRNTIMTVEEAGQLPHAVTLKVSQHQEENSIVAAVSSSIAGFQKMLVGIEKDKASSEETESGDSKNKANSFAARTGNSTDAVEIKKIESVDALLEYLTAHPETKLEIASGQAACYLANTTLPEDARSVPHFWAFTGSMINANQTGAWAEVRVIAPLYKYITRYKNVIFVTKNEKVTGNFTNCCFPEFLSSKYTRNCGKAFERLNTVEKIGLPEAGVTEAAIGVGTSGQNEKGTFSAIKFKLNGIEISIGKLYI